MNHPYDHECRCVECCYKRQDIKDYLAAVPIVTEKQAKQLAAAVRMMDANETLQEYADQFWNDGGEPDEVKMGGPVCGSGIGSEVGLATDPSRLHSFILTEGKTCDQCGVTAKWSSADCPICFGHLTGKTPSPPPQSPP